jgi:hypothetical protein
MGAAVAEIMSSPVSFADDDQQDAPALRSVTQRSVTQRSATQRSATQRDGLVALLAAGAVRTGRQLGSDGGVVSGADLLPVLPALRGLLPMGGLQRGSVVTVSDWNLLCLALAAGPVSAGAWCAAAGIAEFGVVAAADAGLDPARLLLVPELGPSWAHVVSSLLDGCELVLLRPPDQLPAQARRKLEAAVRRHGAVLLIAGSWEGAQVRLRVASKEWVGVGSGYGRLRACRVQVVADGRGELTRSRSHWLWLPGADGTVTQAARPGSAGTVTQATDESGSETDEFGSEEALAASTG